jgi:hypothetical protein
MIVLMAVLLEHRRGVGKRWQQSSYSWSIRLNSLWADGAAMLKLNGSWLCGLSSVPQGSSLSRLRSSHPCQVSIRDIYERIVISGASLMGLEDAYWYSSEHWYVYVLTDPFLNLHLLHRYYVCTTVVCLRTN